MKLLRTVGAGMVALAPAAGSGSGALAKTPDDQIVVGLSMNNILSLDPPSQTGRESLEIQLAYEAVPAMQAISQATDSVALRADVKNYNYHYSWTTRFREVRKER